MQNVGKSLYYSRLKHLTVFGCPERVSGIDEILLKTSRVAGRSPFYSNLGTSQAVDGQRRNIETGRSGKTRPMESKAASQNHSRGRETPLGAWRHWPSPKAHRNGASSPCSRCTPGRPRSTDTPLSTQSFVRNLGAKVATGAQTRATDCGTARGRTPIFRESPSGNAPRSPRCRAGSDRYGTLVATWRQRSARAAAIRQLRGSQLDGQSTTVTGRPIRRPQKDSRSVSPHMRAQLVEESPVDCSSACATCSGMPWESQSRSSWS